MDRSVRSVNRRFLLLIIGVISILAIQVGVLSAQATSSPVGESITGSMSGEVVGKGVAISRDGERVAVADRTRLEVYEFDGDGWSLVNGMGYGFGRSNVGDDFALNADGSRLVVGLPFLTGGQVHVFDVDDDMSLVGEALVGGGDLPFFGSSVAINDEGSRLAVGSPNHMFTRGAVVVFDQIGGEWSQVGGFIEGHPSSRFGESVAMSADGSRLVVGSSRANDAFSAAGQLRVFELSSDEWLQVGDGIDGIRGTDKFGLAVAMSADGTRVVSQGARSVANPNVAQVRVFDDVDSEWVQVGGNLDGGDRSVDGEDNFGITFALSGSGDRLAVGASRAGRGAVFESGRVEVFEIVNSVWTAVGTFTGDAASDLLGRSVSLNGDGTRLVAGATGFDGDQVNVGQVVVQSIPLSLPRCGDRQSTLVGTSGDDVLVGTASRDVIVGLQGNDVISGLGGDDIVCAGRGDDVIYGGAGFDILFGAQGDDIIYAADGESIAERQDSRGARMFGGAGNDEIHGSSRWDRLQGGPGGDSLFGYEGRDWIRGGAGSDGVAGGPNSDDLHGGSGKDRIFVSGADTVRGGAGAQDRCILLAGSEPVRLVGCELS